MSLPSVCCFWCNKSLSNQASLYHLSNVCNPPYCLHSWTKPSRWRPNGDERQKFCWPILCYCFYLFCHRPDCVQNNITLHVERSSSSKDWNAIGKSYEREYKIAYKSANRRTRSDNDQMAKILLSISFRVFHKMKNKMFEWDLLAQNMFL